MDTLERSGVQGMRWYHRYHQNKRNGASNEVKRAVRIDPNREWEDHKYIDRVQTKSGKWRYIYEEAQNKGRQAIQNIKQSLPSRPVNIKSFGNTSTPLPQSRYQLNPNSRQKLNAAYEQTKNMKFKEVDTSNAKFDNKAKPILNSIPEKIKEAAKKIIDFILPDYVKTDIENKRRRESNVQDPGIKTFSSDADDSFQENREIHTELKKKTIVMSKDEDMAAVNPKLDKDYIKKIENIVAIINTYAKIGDRDNYIKYYREYVRYYTEQEPYFSNCANCTLAYDMRRRGYDVEAPRSTVGLNRETLLDLYKDIKDSDITNYKTSAVKKYNKMIGKVTLTKDATNEYKTAKELSENSFFTKDDAKNIESNMLSKYPEGSYGYFMAAWGDLGSHAMVWSKEDGEIVIRDCQTNEKHTVEDIATKSIVIDAIRTDDKEFSELAYDYVSTGDINKYKQSLKYKYDRVHNALTRSAEGSQWLEHKYIDIIDGRYIYDEDTLRRINGGASPFESIRAANRGKDWHDVIKQHVSNMIKKNPNLSTSSIRTARIQDFADTIKALTDIDVDNMKIRDLENMRKEIADYYDNNPDAAYEDYGDETEEIQNEENENAAMENGLKKKTREMSEDEDMAAINPNYGGAKADKLYGQCMAAYDRGDLEKGNKLYDEYMKVYNDNSGYSTNCVNCTLAYDMRRRGYDVTAPSNKGTTSITAMDIPKLYNCKDSDVFRAFANNMNAGFNKTETSSMYKNMASKYQDGARGFLSVTWAVGGGHTMAWCKENGRVIIRDCQSNEKKDLEEVLSKCVMAQEFRTDDKDPTSEAYGWASATDFDEYRKRKR